MMPMQYKRKRLSERFYTIAQVEELREQAHSRLRLASSRGEYGGIQNRIQQLNGLLSRLRMKRHKERAKK